MAPFELESRHLSAIPIAICSFPEGSLGESDTAMKPHAWQVGAQTTLLKNQLSNLREGGTFVICPPPNPFRCPPPGSYERVSMIAHYFKQHKPKLNILILDAKSKFSKQKLFQHGWQKHYGFGTENSLIEWVAERDGYVNSVDVKNCSINVGDLENSVKADVSLCESLV